MSVAGKDCTREYNKFHRWVNADSMLMKCVVGILMADSDKIDEEEEGEEDAKALKDVDEQLAKKDSAEIESTISAMSRLEMSDEEFEKELSSEKESESGKLCP